MSATTADFPTKHCAWSMRERGRIENTHLAKACSYLAIANQVLYRMVLLHRPLRSLSCRILPVKVSFPSLIASSTMSYWWNIKLTKKESKRADFLLSCWCKTKLLHYQPMTNATYIFYNWTALIQKIARTSQITDFIMLLVSVRYSNCYGNVTLGKLRPDMNCWMTGDWSRT